MISELDARLDEVIICYRLHPAAVGKEVDVVTRDVKGSTTRRQKIRVSLGLGKREQIGRACDYAGLLVGGTSLQYVKSFFDNALDDHEVPLFEFIACART